MTSRGWPPVPCSSASTARARTIQRGSSTP
jgi:hypothetical protein